MSPLGINLGVLAQPLGVDPSWFISIWNTSNTSAGSSASNQVKLPLTSAGTYNFDVDWGDGNTDTITSWNQAEVTHTYAVAGTYTIICKPNAPGHLRGFRFAQSGDRLKFLDVIQFGGLQLVNNQGQTFFGCAYFTGASITDVLDTVGVTSMSRMFQGCNSYNAAVNFDTSSVTTMFNMFRVANTFNQPINFNTSSVITMAQMFQQASNFNQPLNFNTSSVISISNMFVSATNFNQNISTWDINQVTSFENLMVGVTLSTANYDALLISWANQLPFSPSARTINFGNSKYTSTNQTVVDARDALIAHFTTAFVDGGPA